MKRLSRCNGKVIAFFRILPALFLIGLFLPNPTFGDGKFFFRTIPTLEYKNYQRALVTFFNGFENLIIQPLYSGYLNDFGWIIPVPSLPQVISIKSQQTNHLLAWSRFETREKSIPLFLFALAFFSIISLALTVNLLYRLFYYLRYPKTPKGQFPEWSIFLFSLAFLSWCSAIPILQSIQRSFGTSSSSSSEGPVRIHYDEVFEDYHYRVIDSSSTQSLMQWFKDNSFSYNQSDSGLFDAFNAKGYSYVAIKLSPKGIIDATSSVSTLLPPICFSVKTPEAFYPYELTSTVPGTMTVDLFSISDHPMYSSSTNLLSSQLLVNEAFQKELLSLINSRGNEDLLPLASKSIYVSFNRGEFQGGSLHPDILLKPDFKNTIFNRWRFAW